MAPPQHRPVFFFDIDNCLYPHSAGVQDHMQRLIDEYFVRHLELSPEDARQLHARYYKDYGLAISGLVKYHKINPLAYNREVDDALPLDEIIKPDPQLHRLLSDIDRSKVKLWLFTNAYITHARRVIKLLGVEDMFEGVTYCDYSKEPLLAKPHVEMFEKAERDAGVMDVHDCLFVDDSSLNCQHATARGWTVIHKLEEEDPEPEVRGSRYQIRDLQEIRQIFPELFASDASPRSGTQGEGHPQL
ncbi:putative suppressor of disruption of TFIIS [Lecanora helva]